MGHEQAGEVPTRALLGGLGVPPRVVEEVVPLVVEHLKPEQLYQARAGDAAIRRLARRVGRIDRLVAVARADARGRPPLEDSGTESAEWLLERARSLAVEAAAPRPMVLGRHLVAAGLEPGPGFRTLLDRCFEAQLDGVFGDVEGGVRFLQELLEANGRPVRGQSAGELREPSGSP
jgi:tRNA nucleotidyltransferase (CCA-adding enzyme)